MTFALEPFGLRPQRLHAGVDPVDVALLGGDLLLACPVDDRLLRSSLDPPGYGVTPRPPSPGERAGVRLARQRALTDRVRMEEVDRAQHGRLEGEGGYVVVLAAGTVVGAGVLDLGRVGGDAVTEGGATRGVSGRRGRRILQQVRADAGLPYAERDLVGVSDLPHAVDIRDTDEEHPGLR